MADIWDIIAPSDLTAYSRRFALELPILQGDPLADILPDRQVRSIKVRVRSITRTLATARFRTWDAENYIARRPFTLGITELELPPLGQKLDITERELLEIALGNGGQNADLIAQIYDDAETNVRATLARMWLAKGDLVTDGKVSITENGLSGVEADFAMDASHLPTASTLWSDVANSLPLTDELNWRKQMVTDGSPRHTIAKTSETVFNFLLRNAQYKAAFNSNAAASVPDLRPDQLQQVRSTWNLPPITLADEMVEHDDVMTRIVPEHKFLMAAPDAGETQWGITAQALEAAAGNSDPAFTRNDAPGIFTAAFKETGERVKRFTSTHAVGLPVLFEKSRLVSASVIAAS
jgi:hypothetical protein